MRVVIAATIAIAGPAAAQTPLPDPALQARIAQLPAILAGAGVYDTYFAPNFVKAVPEAQFRAIGAQIAATLGKPVRIVSSTATSPHAATVVVGCEHGTASVTIEIEATPPSRVSGLLVTGTALAGDTAAKLDADFQALPGAAGFGIYRLDGPVPRAVHAYRGDVAAPLGSAFKLWILAEAARQVAAGTRRWSDVVPLARASLPSGITQAWPAATPMTLQSLATLMISISDNTATDTLLATLGRDNVGRIATATGAPATTLPILSTREMFTIKRDPAWIARWANGDAAARTALLADPAFVAAQPDRSIFRAGPVAPETVEWFASPQSIAAIFARLAAADATTRAILAVDPTVDGVEAARFAYVGYKGGAEPGVVTMNYLLRTHDGAWLAVTGNWHDPAGAAAVGRFQPLMARALALAGR